MRMLFSCALIAGAALLYGCGNEEKKSPAAAPAAPAAATPRPAAPNAPVAVSVNREPVTASAPAPAARPQARYLSEPELAEALHKDTPPARPAAASPAYGAGAPAPTTPPQPSRELMALEAEAPLPELKSDDFRDLSHSLDALATPDSLRSRPGAGGGSVNAPGAYSAATAPVTRELPPRNAAGFAPLEMSAPEPVPAAAPRPAAHGDLDLDGPELGDFDPVAYTARSRTAAPARRAAPAAPAVHPGALPPATPAVPPAPRPVRVAVDGPEIG